MSDPVVSVVMTTFNGEKYIADAINSVLAQTFPEFELLVIDDSSTDDTVGVVRSFEDPRVRLIENEQNLGISRSRNIGIDQARGRYIASHDHDDISYPNRLKIEVDLLEREPQVVMVGSRSDRIPSSGNTWPPLPLPTRAALPWFLFTSSPFAHSTTCFRKSTLDKQGIRFNHSFPYAEDYEIYCRLSEVGELVLLPDVLGAFRKHETNTSQLKNDEMTANGCAFLRVRYNQYLGSNVVGEEEIKAIWHVLVEKRSAESEKQLLKLGAILDAQLGCYLDRQSLNLDAQNEVFICASHIWKVAVERTAWRHGPWLMRHTRSFENLAQQQDKISRKLLTFLSAWVRFLKNMCFNRYSE